MSFLGLGIGLALNDERGDSNTVDFSTFSVGTPLPAGTLPGGGSYAQAAGSGQAEETVQTSASTVARWAFVANLPRIGLLADGGIGLVLEPPRTNDQVRSDANHAEWVITSVTKAAVQGPDGIAGSAVEVTDSGGATGFISRPTNYTGGATYVSSVWVLSVSGAGGWGAGHNDGNPDDGIPIARAGFVSWARRVPAAYTALAGPVSSWSLIPAYTAAADVGVVRFWGNQREIGKYATNHIPTAGTTASRAGFSTPYPISRFVHGGKFLAEIVTVPFGACTDYDADSATIRLWTIDANTYAEINTTTRVLTVSVNGVARVAGVPVWWLLGHRIAWSWEVGNGNLRVRYRLSTDKGVTWTLPFDPFGGVVNVDAAISTVATSVHLWSDSGTSKWFGNGEVSNRPLVTAPAWALQWLPTDDASVKAHLRGDAAYTLSAGAVSAIGSQGATGGLGWAQSTGAKQPSVATSGGKTYLSFDGSNDYLDGAAASSYAGASAKTVWIVAKIRSVTLNGAASYNNHMLVGDGGAGALWGAYAKVGPLAIGYNWDGTDDGVTASVGLAAWTWLRYRHDGSTVYLSVAGGAEVTVASGATSSMAGVLSVGGRASGAWAPIDVQDVIIANSATVGQQAAIDAYCAQRAA